MTRKNRELQIPPPQPIAVRLREYRKRWGLTQEQFGQFVDLSGRYVSQIENETAPLSNDARQRIEAAMKGKPATLAAGDEQLESVRRMIERQDDVYRRLLRRQSDQFDQTDGFPDGTKVFVITASDIRDLTTPERLDDLERSLLSNPLSEWFVLFPAEADWDTRELKGVSSINVGLRQIAQLQELVKKRFQKTDAASRFRIVPIRRQMQYFHPIVKSIVAIPPRDARGQRGRSEGWLEISFYDSNFPPAMIRHSISELIDLANWIDAADARDSKGPINASPLVVAAT